MTDFATQRTAVSEAIEHEIARTLADLLSAEKNGERSSAPTRLIAAMHHGTLNGGKRLRPLLVAQTAEIFGIKLSSALPAALAVELVHCYSLIHDDLPAMDDDDLRRGQPTVHKAFDDATAILAGDALLTQAFVVLADPSCHPDPATRTQLVAELASSIGAAGMVGGQMYDLEGEKADFTPDDIAQMQAMKTGALIKAAVRMGAILGGANEDQLAALTSYGRDAGRAFQLADDILDETATTEQMGKKTGKDNSRTKPTLVAKIGLEAAERHLGDTIHNALSALIMFGPEANGLRETAKYFVERTN